MTDRQRAFLDAYLADPRRNATRAAAAAGYAWPDKQGPRLLSMRVPGEAIRAELARRVAELRAEASARLRAETDARIRADARAFRARLAALCLKARRSAAGLSRLS